MNTKSYLFELDYGNRMEVKSFLLDIMQEFDSSSLTAINLLINNNPYDLEFLLSLVFEKDDERFDDWIEGNYPKLRFMFNYSLNEVIDNQIYHRRYNSCSISNEDQLNRALTEEANELFFFSFKENSE